ncbi:MAG TPA: hypothetical protein VN366_02270 [Feifaniaceae bacterium]|nr:hypothetical protein [Feifaniaceae bacterium]
MDYMTEQQIDSLASDTGAILRAEPRVKLTIAPDSLGGYWEGGINGHFFRIRTGMEVEVPKSLARLISESAKVKLQSEESMNAYRGRGKRVG